MIVSSASPLARIVSANSRCSRVSDERHSRSGFSTGNRFGAGFEAAAKVRREGLRLDVRRAARALDQVERGECLLQRHGVGPEVDLEEVDAVGAQPLQ